MITRKIWLDFFSSEYQEALREMVTRLGWQMDTEPGADGGYAVNIPVSDETLFEMLEPAWS